MKKNIFISDIIDFLGDQVISIYGNPTNIIISYINDSENVDENSLDWINTRKKNKQIIAEQSKAKVILCDRSVVYSPKIDNSNKVLIHVENPKMILAKIAEKYFVKKVLQEIHTSAIIDNLAIIDESVSIGANCTIGKCQIGSGTVIYPNVTVYDNVSIGDNVVIHAGAVIGSDGLGCERKENGDLVKFPHLGGVEISNNVEIGSNCQISRGALSNTKIGAGSKINGLCFIAHNCILGKNVLITGSAMIAGSVIVEDNVTIFSSVVIREQLILGRGCTIGMGSVVTKNVPKGETWFGNPAKKRI